MVKLEEVKRKLALDIINSPKEILQVIYNKKRARQKELLPLINESRRRAAERMKRRTRGDIRVLSMSPRTLHKHLGSLVHDGAIRKEVISHKEVYYLPGARFSEEWITLNIIEWLAKLLNSLDRSLGLIEAIRLFEKIRKKPGRIKELENCARMLCSVFDGDFPPPTGEDYVVIRVYEEDENSDNQA